MADIQPENGTTTIANRLIEDVFMRGLLSKQQMQIVFAVIRESWGWRDRKRSTPQNTVKMRVTRRPLRPKDFAEMTGIHISDVCKILNGLVAARVLRRHWDHYRFEKDFEKWDLEAATSSKKKRDSPQRAKGARNPNRTKEDHGNADVGAMLGNFPNEIKSIREIPYSTREIPQRTGENPYKIEADQLGKKPNAVGENPIFEDEIREKSYSIREIPKYTEGQNDRDEAENPEVQLGKFPNATREIPYSEWGNSLVGQPENPNVTRDSGPLNKKEIKRNKEGYYKPPYLLSILGVTGGRYGEDGLREIERFFEMLRFTRKSGRLAESIVKAEIEYWERFDVDVVLLSLRLHRELYPQMREEYTRGIMRRMQRDKERGVDIHEQVERRIRQRGGSGIRPAHSEAVGARETARTGKWRITDDYFERYGI